MVYSMAAADVQQPEQPEQAAVRAEMQDWMTYPVFIALYHVGYLFF